MFEDFLIYSLGTSRKFLRYRDLAGCQRGERSNLIPTPHHRQGGKKKAEYSYCEVCRASKQLILEPAD